MSAFRLCFTGLTFAAALATVACDDSPAGPDAGSGLRFEQLSVGAMHACGIDNEGVAWCWGENGFGQLGTSAAATAEPVRVSGNHRWSRIAAETVRTCAITTDGELYCWGWLPRHLSDAGMAGDSSAVPLLVDASREWVDLSVSSFVCALDADGAAWCDGPWPVITQEHGFVALPGGIEWASVAAGAEHVCGVATDGSGYCLGRNSYGELGLDPAGVGSAELPVPIGTIDWRTLQAGFHYTCGITINFQMFCWGYNEGGELGAPEPFETHEPVVPTYRTAQNLTVSVGGWDARHVSCAALDGTGVWGCWGDGSALVQIRPPRVGRWDFVGAGINQACGLSEGRVFCWGYLWGENSRIVIADPNLIELPDPS